MKMTKSLFIGLVAASGMLFSLSSCKKCTVAEEDSDTGIIIQDVIVYPKIGYMTQVVNGDYHFDGTGEYADEFEVSFDGGATKGPVDYSAYSILGNPMTVNCKASFVRDVVLDQINNNVIYTVTATTCTSCEAERYVENYILIPKVPNGFSVYYDTDVNAQ